MPLDITVLLDVSGSTGGVFRTRLLRATDEVLRLVRPMDRVQLIEFGGSATRLIDPAIFRQNLRSAPLGDGGTALFDVISLALLQQADPERRRFVVVLTDGIDTASVLDRQTRLDVVARTDGVLFIAALRTSPAGLTLGYRVGIGTSGTELNLEHVGNYDWVLRELAEPTTGDLHELEGEGSLTDLLAKAFDGSRTRYLLRYRPGGVPPGGWHSLRVHVLSGGYEVRARKGYFGG
jgi:hypothetical protein